MVRRAIGALILNLTAHTERREHLAKHFSRRPRRPLAERNTTQHEARLRPRRCHVPQTRCFCTFLERELLQHGSEHRILILVARRLFHTESITPGNALLLLWRHPAHQVAPKDDWPLEPFCAVNRRDCHHVRPLAVQALRRDAVFALTLFSHGTQELPERLPRCHRCHPNELPDIRDGLLSAPSIKPKHTEEP